MPRRSRLVVPEVAHHVTQRGNNRQVVFDSDFDRQLFLDLLADYAQRHRLSILGFCLMSNHFHLVAVPEREDSLARTIGRLEADCARYLNVRRRTAGHLWQARFFSVPMEPRYGATALAYVERNPVRAGMVDVAEEYRWSSAAARLGLTQPPKWLELDDWKQEWSAGEWRQLLRDPRQEDPSEWNCGTLQWRVSRWEKGSDRNWKSSWGSGSARGRRVDHPSSQRRTPDREVVPERRRCSVQAEPIGEPWSDPAIEKPAKGDSVTGFPRAPGTRGSSRACHDGLLHRTRRAVARLPRGRD
ncbi:MAG: transposase [Bryobacteraceae bacterium]